MKKKDLEKYLDSWILEQKYDELSENTLKTYKNGISKFIQWLDDSGYSDINISKDITIEYKLYLREISCSINSANAWITTLNKFLKWLKLDDLKIKKIRQQDAFNNEDVLTIEDYKRLLRIAKRMNMMQTYYIMLTLAMTGIRIEELKYFTVENLDKYYIRVFNKGKERVVPIRQDLRRELKKYCRENKITAGYVFLGQKEGKMPAKSTIWRRMKKIAGKARVKKEYVHAHSFRHLFAQVFLNQNSGNYLDLADILGHSDLKTTRKYTKLSNEQKRRKLENLKF